MAIFAPTTEHDRKRRRIALLALPFVALAVFGAVVPLAVMFRISVAEEYLRSVGGFQVDGWVALLSSVLAFVPVVGSAVDVDPVYGEVVWNSLWFGAITTVASVALGVVIAHALENYDLPGEDLLVTLISFPISLPGIVAAFMMIVWFGKTGLLTNFFVWLAGETSLFPQLTANDVKLTGQPSGTTIAIVGLFLGYLYSMVPRATFLLRGTYAEVNGDAEAAARALGATPWQTFRYVTLPQIRPGVVGAVILTFRTALAIFGTVLVLKALSVVTFRFDQILKVGYDLPTASALAGLFFFFTLGFTFLSLRFTSAEVTG